MVIGMFLEEFYEAFLQPFVWANDVTCNSHVMLFFWLMRSLEML